MTLHHNVVTELCVSVLVGGVHEIRHVGEPVALLELLASNLVFNCSPLGDGVSLWLLGSRSSVVVLGLGQSAIRGGIGDGLEGEHGRGCFGYWLGGVGRRAAI